MRDAAIVPVAALPDAPILHVLFKVDDTLYALPADVVLQMESYTGSTVVPGAPSFVAGIIQLRGRVVPVVDLRARFGLAPKERTLETRVVVGEQHDRTVALVVDSAREVVRMTPSQLKPPPRLVDDGARGFVKFVAQLGDRTVMVLDFAKVIGEEPLDV
ncbi:MAG: putative chemotaxis protein CheW [Myxococcaceae bacterium]|jgi:purine-binding chemotaxis protein CheW|nr:putative chemotaxis protein CheW [Myxococcaceae bacterium]MEA2753224.1 purine-binding chemotaxis protein CheW [Myxococcales bacterium]